MPLVPDPYKPSVVIIDAGITTAGEALDHPVLEGVHLRSECQPHHCVIHDPSNHPLRDAPMRWRDDLQVMERLCGHGFAHPDPDSVAFIDRTWLVHSARSHDCDGCCETPMVIY